MPRLEGNSISVPKKGLGLKNRLSFLWYRARNLNASSLTERAREVAQAHKKTVPGVVMDMLWSAAFKNVGFQDYVDFDFATLTRAERATYMTHPISYNIAKKYDDPSFQSTFHDKIEFNRVFDEYLGREWIELSESTVDDVRKFTQKHRLVIGKVPVSDSGHGVSRYDVKEISDWNAFRAELIDKGQTLLEENIAQHSVLAEICPGTANTTRITTFFDGEQTHILSMAQKFGRGQASDQQTYGGFYTMLNLDGSSRGRGYDSHGNVYETHPESGVSIPDFQLPMVEELVAFIDSAARVVPQMQYIGWDVVIGADRPILVEGNWAAGVYENKPTVTGIRTGSLPRYKAVIGF